MGTVVQFGYRYLVSDGILNNRTKSVQPNSSGTPVSGTNKYTTQVGFKGKMFQQVEPIRNTVEITDVGNTGRKGCQVIDRKR